MKNSNKKTLALLIISLFITLSLTPIVSSLETVKLGNTQLQSNGEEIELDLLRGEYYLYIDAKENVSSFNISHVFPLEYGYQVPIIMEILDDTNATILDYKIGNDINEPNKVVNFTIGSMNKGDRDLIHFNYWVLVKNYDYSDLPNEINIPKENELPPETTKWLSSTDVVQKDRILLRLRARQMKFLTNDVLKLAQRTVRFCKSHRPILSLVQSWLGSYRSQDAFTTLLINGECPGRSHLGCTLFRANNVPARVILTSPSYNFWYKMYYMAEYYSGQKFGWILTDVHQAKTPHEPKKQIILRICYPEDENDTQTDFIYPKMTGVERWIWIDNEYVKPYYKDCKEGSKTRMFRENEVFAVEMPGEEAYNLTGDLFHKYEYYLNMDLTGQNLEHFQKAVDYQMDAIGELRKPDTDDAFGYLYYMYKARDEYAKIIIR